MCVKKQLMCALMALLLVSCSKTPDTAITNSVGDVIDFSAYSGLTNTRALDKAKFGVGDKITVSTFHHKGDIGKVDPDTGQPHIFVANFFDNLTVSAEGTAEKYEWMYDNERYWPINDDEYLSLVATYSQTPRNITITEAGEIKINDFVVGTDVSTQEDLLWSGVPNRMSNSGVVTFTFNHALSKINFVAQTAAVYPNATVKIKSIVIKDIINKGSYTFGALGENFVAWNKGFWSLPSNTGNTGNISIYTPFANSVPLEVTANSVNVGESLLLIPQVVTNKAIYLNYSITNNELNEETDQAEIIIRPKVNWNQNTQYTYNLNFKLNKINFVEIIIDEWETPIIQEVPSVVLL